MEGPREINVNTTVSYSVYAVNTTSEPHNLHLSSSLPGVEADFTLPAGSAAGWSLPFTTADPGEQLLEFTLAQQEYCRQAAGAEGDCGARSRRD